ncbi:type-F conjugative transfer system pilin assembly protein TrbC [Serratia fonticola]|uniref:Type-F conjugative transfer system pilin assembly protein TrbC n=1 Tax=Serratia fonticola TaxID=47917 RepID=A0AAJ2DAT4_SERFO|nr:type-F conjugative transfer system pilin assembly protein TrbC [Serratia fonticola]MDQ9128469.1 type-F conjugative transfer system pilin assembly protein TrbC [Serratia fonticola]
MKIHTILMVAGLAGMTAVGASEHIENRQFIKEQLQLDRQRFRALTPPDELVPDRPLSAANSSFIDKLAEQQRQSSQRRETPQAGAVVFASFSMPENDLRQRVADATERGIPVVLRGMVGGDMRQTANAVVKLVKDSNQGGVQIDPVAFRTYGVQSVPVLVVTCGEGLYDRVHGDITLADALRKVAEDGECAATARHMLGREAEE